MLAAVTGDETQVVPGMVRPPSGAWHAPGAPAAERPPSGTQARPPSGVHARPPSGVHALPPRVVVRAPRWLAALAAVLALAAVGLGIAAAHLAQELSVARLAAAGHEQAAARLTDELADVRAGLAAGAEAREGELRSMRDELALVTAPTTEVCSLTPPRSAPVSQARGLLFVAEDHQHWYLRIDGLEPLAGGQVYQLWFVADGPPIPAGTFEPGPARQAELSSPEMPLGTRAALVTREPAAGGTAPRGPVVLFGDELRQLL
jgi:hypothetical protein